MNAQTVYLIGAGPGHPDLITVRGLECLARADVVVHDRAISPRLLRRARPEAELIDVGDATRLAEREAIGYLILEKNREHKIVARLTRGDPFVFDRGGEEALFLREQGVGVEIVPGVPTVIGAAAYAGVPLTWPGESDTLTIVRGHEDERRTRPGIDWAGLVRLGGTIAAYAAPQQLPRMLEALRASGWPAGGRAAVVYRGTLPGQTSVTGTLDELIDTLRQHPRREPAVAVVGPTVRLRERLRWHETRPLSGCRVLVTRPREQSAALVDQLTALGAEPIEAPMIRIVPPADLRPLQRAVAELQAFDWIVFTSVNAVDAFMGVLLDGTRDVRALKGPVLAVVGAGTAARLAHYGIIADLVPDQYRAEALAAAILERGAAHGRRVLLPRSEIGREVIAEMLRRNGASVTDVVAYRTVLEERVREGDPDVYRMLLEGQIDVVTFTSASAVRNFAALYGADQVADLLRRTIVGVIGPVTAEAVTRLGVPVTVQPATYTIPAFVQALATHVMASRSARPSAADLR